MRKYILFLIALFSCSNIFSQNLSALFKNDLPKDINKYFTEESVNDILIQDAELNPELLYWRINFFKVLVENNATDNDKNGLNHINKMVYDNRLEKNDFLNEIKKRAGENVSAEYKRKINDILDEHILNYPLASGRKDNVPDYDANKVYFITAKYFSGDPELSYNWEKVYQGLAVENEHLLTEKLKQKMSEMKSQHGMITIEYVECLIKNWRLVKYNQGILGDMFSPIREYIDQKYSIQKLGRLDITLGYAYTLNDSWYSNDVTFPFINKSDHLSESKNYPSFTLQADYKILLKEYVFFLSYINLGLRFSTASSPSIDHNDFAFYQRYNDINWANYSSLDFKANNIKLSEQKYYSFFGKISLPVFIISPDLILQAGIQTGINYYLADVSYNYSFINTVFTYNSLDYYKYVYLQRDLNVSKSESISRYSFGIYPIFELNYNLLKNVIVKLATSGYNYFSLNAGVEL
jgi:hypothetical protein